MDISVIITAHNRKQYLERAIRSVLDQTLERKHFEIIVVKNYNDKSIDNLIEEHAIRTILAPRDSSVGYDLFHALEISQGEILAFLDDDDTYSSGKLETLLKIFRENDVAYAKNELYFQDDNDRIISRDKRLEIKTDRMIHSNKLNRNIAFLNRIKAGFNLSSISIRKEIINSRAMDFLRYNLVHSTDTFFFCCGLDSGKAIYLCSERLTGYRINESTSKKLGQGKESAQKRIAFWDKLIGAYGQFFEFFGDTSREYLKTRICSQKVAREITKVSAGMERSADFSSKSCLFRAIKTVDILLIYDFLRYLKSRLSN